MMSLSTRACSAPVVAFLLSMFAVVAAGACSGSSSGAGATDVQLLTDIYYGRDAGSSPDTSSDISKPDWVAPDLRDRVRKLGFVDLQGDDGRSCVDATQCTKWFESVEARPLQVRYTEDDRPTEGARILFTIRNDDKGQGQIDPGNGIAVSDGRGQAAVEQRIVSAQELGQFAVEVTVMDHPEVQPLYFNIVVDPKGRPPLTVVPEYAGRQPVDAVKVRLFRQPEDSRNPGSYLSAGLTCAELEPFVRNGEETRLPPATILSPEVEMGGSVVFQNVYFEGLEDDLAQMYSVLVTGQDANRVTRVLGCDDEHALVQAGKSINVVVTLYDLPPRLRGTYDVRSEFDLISALPDGVGNVVYHIINFFESPAEEVLTLLCLIDVSIMNELCDYVFDPQGNPTFIGDMAISIVNAIVEGLGQGNIWGDILYGGRDVGEILTNLTFLSRITFDAEPDPDGLIDAATAHEVWTSIRYRWTLGIDGCGADPNCGWNEFSFTAIDVGTVVEGQLPAWVNTATVDGHAPHTLLTIEEHPLNIRYGALLNFIIQKIVLPRLAGGEPPDGLPVVDSYTELIKVILAGRECLVAEASGGPTCCHAFAENLVAQAGTVTVSLVEGACDALASAGATYLENLLLGLDFETGDPNAANAFLIATPPGEPCILHDVNEDLQIDALGLAGRPCKWLATLRLDLLGVATELFVDADFVGSR